MSNNANYIITTVSKSVSERTLQESVNTDIPLPFRAGPFAQNIRKRTVPYIAVDGGIPPAVDPVNFLDQINDDGTIRADGRPNSPAYIITFTQSVDLVPGGGRPHDFALKVHGVTQSIDLIPADGRPFDFNTLATYTQSVDLVPADGRPFDFGLIWDQTNDDGTIRADGRPNDVTILATFTQSVDLVPADGRPFDFNTLATYTQSANLVPADGRPFDFNTLATFTQSVDLIPADGRPFDFNTLATYTQSVDLVPADGRPYNAGVSVASSNTYTEIVSASNPNNTTAMHVGSLYLDARTYTTFGALITDIKDGVGGSNVHVELRRFTNGVALMSASNTNTAGPTWEYVTQSNVVVSNSDWYDIYISASGNPATSSIRGIFYEY